MTKDNLLISVIVPIYNSERHLEKCINSILNQTYKNLEIILVDDGSTDLSPKMCDAFSVQDSRIKVIHQKNQRQAAARNTGIDVASGDYIMFVDSDDYIAHDMCEYLMNGALSYNADIAICGTINVHLNGNVYFKKERIETITMMNAEEALRSYVDPENNLCSQSPCDKLYKKEVIGNERFPVGKWYEDLATIYKFVAKASKIVYLNEGKYYYVEHEMSTMKKPFSKHSFDTVDAYHNLDLFLRNKYPHLCYYVNRCKLGSIFYCVGEAYKHGLSKELNQEINWAVNLAKDINTPLNLKQKVLSFCLMADYRLFGNIYKMFKG